MRIRRGDETDLRALNFARGRFFVVGIVFVRFLTGRLLWGRGMWNTLKPYLRFWTVAAGAFAGYLYWQEIGCVSGACPITSNPWISTLYGTVIGILLIPKKKVSLEGHKENDGPEANREVGA